MRNVHWVNWTLNPRIYYTEIKHPVDRLTVIGITYLWRLCLQRNKLIRLQTLDLSAVLVLKSLEAYLPCRGHSLQVCRGPLHKAAACRYSPPPALAINGVPWLLLCWSSDESLEHIPGSIAIMTYPHAWRCWVPLTWLLPVQPEAITE